MLSKVLILEHLRYDKVLIAVWERCQVVRKVNRRRNTPYEHRRHLYALTPLLICARCGANIAGRTRPELNQRYYDCRNHRNVSDNPRIDERGLAQEIRNNLAQCLPNAQLDSALRERLRQGVRKGADPAQAYRERLRALDNRAQRVNDMFELGNIDQPEYVRRTSDINLERQRVRQEADAQRASVNYAWLERQVVDLLKAWDTADESQRGRLLAQVYERIEAEKQPDGTINLTCVPHPDWQPLFARAVYGTGDGLRKVAAASGQLVPQRWSDD